MNSTRRSAPSKAPPTDPYLDKLNELLAAAIERVRQLQSAIAVHREMNGTPDTSGQLPGSAAGEPPAKPTRSAPPPTAATKRERQLQVARHMLAHGGMTFSQIGQFLRVSNDSTARVVRSPWFQKADGGSPGSPSPWVLTPAGRAVVTRSVPPPVPVAAEPPTAGSARAADLRPNADLDLFFAELQRGPDAGKASPRPFSANGAGTTHTNWTAAAAESTSRQVLRFLAERGPLPFTVLCSLVPTNHSTVNKSLNNLAAKALVRKQEGLGHKAPWEITAKGRADLGRG